MLRGIKDDIIVNELENANHNFHTITDFDYSSGSYLNKPIWNRNYGKLMLGRFLFMKFKSYFKLTLVSIRFSDIMHSLYQPYLWPWVKIQLTLSFMDKVTDFLMFMTYGYKWLWSTNEPIFVSILCCVWVTGTFIFESTMSIIVFAESKKPNARKDLIYVPTMINYGYVASASSHAVRHVFFLVILLALNFLMLFALITLFIFLMIYYIFIFPVHCGLCYVLFQLVKSLEILFNKQNSDTPHMRPLKANYHLMPSESVNDVISDNHFHITIMFPFASFLLGEKMFHDLISMIPLNYTETFLQYYHGLTFIVALLIRNILTALHLSGYYLLMILLHFIFIFCSWHSFSIPAEPLHIYEANCRLYLWCTFLDGLFDDIIFNIMLGLSLSHERSFYMETIYKKTLTVISLIISSVFIVHRVSKAYLLLIQPYYAYWKRCAEYLNKIMVQRSHYRNQICRDRTPSNSWTESFDNRS
jgi:hypothetical protein